MGMSLTHLAWFVGGGVAAWLISASEGNYVPFVLYLLVAGATYVTSLHLHPSRACWACEGSGKATGLIFGYARRQCGTCGGSGRRLRLGARMLRIDPE